MRVPHLPKMSCRANRIGNRLRSIRLRVDKLVARSTGCVVLRAPTWHLRAMQQRECALDRIVGATGAKKVEPVRTRNVDEIEREWKWNGGRGVCRECLKRTERELKFISFRMCNKSSTRSQVHSGVIVTECGCGWGRARVCFYVSRDSHRAAELWLLCISRRMDAACG